MTIPTIVISRPIAIDASNNAVIEKHHNAAPSFDRGLRARNLACAGMVVAWMLSASSLIAGVILTLHPASPSIPPTVASILPLNFISIVTVVTEALGFVHGTTQRWALQRENRLAFHSNLRVFTAARASPAHSWYANTLILIGTVVAFASASFVIVQSNDARLSAPPFLIFGPALITLGIGLLLQVLITTWAFSTTTVPTWSARPLDTLKACQADGTHRHHGGRALQGASQSASPSAPTWPCTQQSSAWESHREVKKVVMLLAGLVPLAFVWAGVVLLVPAFEHRPFPPLRWSLVPVDAAPSVINGEVGLEANNIRRLSAPWGLATAFFFLIMLMQAVLTMTLHCADLLAALTRDESAWRRAARCGIPAATNPLVASMTHAPTCGLLHAKPAAHFLFGLCFRLRASPGADASVLFRPLQILNLAALLLVLAGLAVLVARRRPKGPQPAAYGHLQTLADLVDRWPRLQAGGKLFWGSTGVDEDGFGMAGVANKPLEPICMERQYM